MGSRPFFVFVLQLHHLLSSLELGLNLCENHSGANTEIGKEVALLRK